MKPRKLFYCFRSCRNERFSRHWRNCDNMNSLDWFLLRNGPRIRPINLTLFVSYPKRLPIAKVEKKNLLYQITFILPCPLHGQNLTTSCLLLQGSDRLA